jgi:hypothetical protein
MAQLPLTDPIANLTNILDLFNGKETQTVDSPTTRTSTTKSNLTAEQLNQLISQEMLPLAMAGHSAGISGYGDTTLQLGRSQVAGNILAKAAGSTTTETTSGGTRTTSNPGPLSSSRLGDTAKSLLLTQVGAPLLKKLGNKVDPTSWIDSAMGGGSGFTGMGSMADSVTDPFSNSNLGTTLTTGTASDIGANYGTEGLDNLFGSSDLGSSLLDLGTGAGIDAASTLEPGVSDALDLADSGGGGIGDFFSSLFGLKNGGMVRAPGYATGGVVGITGVDRTPAAINPTPVVNPIISANGAVDTSPRSSMATGSMPGSTGTTTSTTSATPTVARTATSKAYDVVSQDAGSTGAGGGPSNGTLGGFGSGIAGIALGMALGHAPSVLGMLSTVNNAVNSTPQDISSMATPDDTDPTGTLSMQAVNDAIAQDATDAGSIGDGLGLGLGLGAGDGLGDSSGLGSGEGSAGVAATGGNISGPGTGTSDSINLKVSNGETVITAQTTEMMRKMFGDDVFNKMEQKFNPIAAKAQKIQGRI